MFNIFNKIIDGHLDSDDLYKVQAIKIIYEYQTARKEIPEYKMKYVNQLLSKKDSELDEQKKELQQYLQKSKNKFYEKFTDDIGFYSKNELKLLNFFIENIEQIKNIERILGDPIETCTLIKTISEIFEKDSFELTHKKAHSDMSPLNL